MKTSFVSCVLAIVSKDLRTEMRSRDVLSVMAMFALLSILVFSFALELDRVARVEAVSGVFWVTIIFASILGFNRSLALERDRGNLDALLAGAGFAIGHFCGQAAGQLLVYLDRRLGDLAADDGAVQQEYAGCLADSDSAGRHLRFLHNRHLAGDDDRANPRPRGIAADCAAAGGAAAIADGGASDDGDFKWKTGR